MGDVQAFLQMEVLVDIGGMAEKPCARSPLETTEGAGQKPVPLVSSRKRIYYSNICGRGGRKIPDLKLRTALADFKVLCETNCRPGGEKSINLNSQAVALVANQLGFEDG